MRSAIYTVYEHDDRREPVERIVLVKEGFSFWAFLFTILWLLAHKLWRMSLVYFLMVLALVEGGGHAGLSMESTIALQLGLQLWLGFSARDMQRAALEREGYVLKEIVCAESELMAERRYFDRAQPAA